MKEILYNTDTLENKKIDKIVRRAKLLFYNDRNEILIGTSDNNYQIIGGHVEENESDRDCIIREIYEESGLDVDLKDDIKPFISIKYYCENYPCEGINTLYEADYYSYYFKGEFKTNPKKLTEEEKKGNFHCETLLLDNAIEVLEKSLGIAKHPLIVRDTIAVITEFINGKDCLENTNKF